jgi:serine/threonine protein kinase
MVRFDGYVKVLDFGLAKRIPGLTGPQKSDDTATAASTVPGRIIGTVAYMSPEQILGQELDSRSDLFAFGIILYEIMAGRHPWPHEVTVETLHAILKDPPPPTPPSSLLRTHAPIPLALPSFSFALRSKSLRRSLPAPAASRIFPTFISENPSLDA